MGMEELAGFAMKNSLTLPSLANKYFSSLRDGNDERIYTNNDKFLRHSVRKSIKGGRCGSFNQSYKSSISDQVFNIISKKLNVHGNIGGIKEKNFEYTRKHTKIIENEYHSQFDDYRDANQEKRTNYINKKLSKLTTHEKLEKLNLNDVMMDFVPTSLYHSAVRDENAVYPKIETGFAFKPDMKKLMWTHSTTKFLTKVVMKLLY